MTKRHAARGGAPDGHVLTMEELQICLGIIPNTTGGSAPAGASTGRPEFLIIGHDMEDDLAKMRKDGIEPGKYLEYSGCVDTIVMAEDVGESPYPSLSALMERYGFAELELSCPRDRRKMKKTFPGAHCAGNDSVATLKVGIAQPFASALRSRIHNTSGSEDKPTEEWYDKPLKGKNPNLILIAYDTESVDNERYIPSKLNRTSEQGFGWLRTADIIDVAPGRYGHNWHKYVKVKHWINQDFELFRNNLYVVGDPWGFWEEYGESEFYYPSEGSAPFDRLFKDLAAGRTVRKAIPSMTAKALRGTNSGNRGTPRGGRDGRGGRNTQSGRGSASTRGDSSARRGPSARSGPFMNGGPTGPTTRGGLSSNNTTAQDTRPASARTTVTISTTSKESSTIREKSAVKESTTTKESATTSNVTISWAQVAGRK